MQIDENKILKTNILASADQDKADVSDLAALIKGQMKKDPTSPVEPGEDDIYIDKDGKIHYPEKK